MPIIISPVFTQTIGDISAAGRPASLAPNQQSTPVLPGPAQAPPANVATPDDGKKDLLLAESAEKLRSMKTILKATKEGYDRERKIYESQLQTADGMLDRERVEFNRERDNIVNRYEKALESKDQKHQDTLEELKTLQSYFANSHFGEDDHEINHHHHHQRNLEMEAPKNSTAEAKTTVGRSNVRSRRRA